MQLKVRRRSGAAAVVAACAAALCSTPAVAFAARARPRGAALVDVPVAFTVTNSNGSGVACQSDGARYTVRGHLVATRAALRARTRTITVYLHDFGIGEWFWRFRAVPGYDFSAHIARDGHPAVTIDELGYGRSGRPPGTGVCLGSQADVLHQIVQRLRRGDYSAGRLRAPSFSRVVLAGHSSGAEIAEIEAYSFADVAGLAILGYADGGSSQRVLEQGVRAGLVCAAGGQPSNGDSGPGGYVYFEQSADEFASSFFELGNADPRVVAAATARRSRGPCGDLESAPTGMAVDEMRLSEITVPVLLVYGERDGDFPPSGEQGQRQALSGSHDVTSAILPGTGHAFTLERTAPVFTNVVDRWLTRHWGAPVRPRAHRRPAAHRRPRPHRRPRRPRHRRPSPPDRERTR